MARQKNTKCNGDPAWKTCKCLGSVRRKGLAINTYNKLKYIIENKKTSRRTKKGVLKGNRPDRMQHHCEKQTPLLRAQFLNSWTMYNHYYKAKC